MKPEEVYQWFNKDVLPTAVKTGRFVENAADVKLLSCQFEAAEKGISSFASEPAFAKIAIQHKNTTVLKNVLVKFQSQDPVFREKMRLVSQFKNEVTMYNTIVPSFVEFLKKRNYKTDLIKEIVPECYFAMHKDDDIEKSVLVIEDLRGEGYKLSDSVTILDLKHCLAALEKLAKFHAISFAMKLDNWEHFEKLKNLFVHVWMADDPITREMTEDFKGYVCQRGINYLLSLPDSEVPKEYLEKFRKKLEPIFDLLRSLHTAEEPLSVICHGDFNRNNILFQYNNEEVVGAKLFDFQTYLYGSPCLDLTFFIYMNTTLEFREKHFEDIFNYYYTTLIQIVSNILNKPEEDISKQIPLAAFKDDFAKVAIQAYPTVSFFLPVMMAPTDIILEEDMNNKTFKEMAEENYTQGGEDVSKRIAEIIIDFYRREFYM